MLALEFTELRILGALSTGQNVGPESSLLKTRGTELQQQISELWLEFPGITGSRWIVPHPLRVITFSQPVPTGRNGVAQSYFNLRKVSIYAGSNEIQRNIMAKLVLGL